MTTIELLKYCADQIEKCGRIEFENQIFESITAESALAVAKEFSSIGFMKLPEKEIRFFEHLKSVDPDVWYDLWEDETAEPYTVGIAFLPVIIEKRRGFPICDLLKNDNFFFTADHLAGEDTPILIETARTLFRENRPLTLAQLLVLEISIDPIDIWRFAYLYSVSAENVKNVVKELVAENMLIHLTSAEHLAPFVTKSFAI